MRASDESVEAKRDRKETAHQLQPSLLVEVRVPREVLAQVALVGEGGEERDGDTGGAARDALERQDVGVREP